MLSEDEKAIQFYKRFIEMEEQELEWMYKEDEEYYKDSIEQKELLIKGWKNILNLITKLQKENEEKDKQIDLMANHIATSDSDLCQFLDISKKCKYYAGENGKLCDVCIKNYFKKLAKEKDI